MSNYNEADDVHTNRIEADKLFLSVTNNEPDLTFEQIMERLADVGYWRKAGLTDYSLPERRKHTRAKLRSLHAAGFVVFNAFRGGSSKQGNTAHRSPTRSSLRQRRPVS